MVVEPSIRGYGFEIGDLVWAKMKSQLWWPGHVYNEEFATPLVRRSKREGLLLVAFFGASSSYGWFDSSELISFDANYAEKSRQTDARTFVRAVEDAIREVNRRIELGLCCKCCNEQNFRETDVQGFAVEKTRDSFQPKLTLDFLRQLALEQTVSEDVDIGFIKNKATVMSYRKAVFKDFAQAFGYDPVCASEMSSKAPLSDREVFADGFGEVKNTAKLKDHAKKDEYLFKLRDESKEIKKVKQNVASSPLPVLSKDPTIAAGEFTLKDATGSLEETPPTVLEHNNLCFQMSAGIVESSTTSSVAESDQAIVRSATAKKTGQPEIPKKSDDNYEKELSGMLHDLLSLAVDPCNTVNRGSRIKGKKVFLRFRSLVFQKGQNFSLQLSGGEPHASKSSEDSVEVALVKPPSVLKRGPSDRQEEMAVTKKKKVGDIRNLTNGKKVIKIDEPPVKQAVETRLKKAGPGFIKKTEQQASEPTMLIMKFPQGGSLPSFTELKAKFARYGPMDHSATQIFRNTFSCRVVFRHKAHAEVAYSFVLGTNSLFGNTDVKCRLKEVQDAGVAEPEPPIKIPKEDHHQPSMEDRSLSMVPATSGVQLKSVMKISGNEESAGNGCREVCADGLGKFMNTAKLEDHAKKEETDLSLVLSDLHSLAVGPFNTVNRGSRIKLKKALLSFRSLVFRRRQNFSLPLAGGEPNASKSSEDSVEVPGVKPKGGLKRGLSDCQEDMAVAKRKKVGDITNLTKEKKVTKKIDEPPARDVKQLGAAILRKPGSEMIKKTEQGPTMLMIKFPQGGSLPSFSELKARFACYGPMDHSGTHIFWNTFSCQVVFKHRAHALAAYKFVVGSSSLFGNRGVKCRLEKVGIVGSAKPEPSVKVSKEDRQQPEMEDRSPSMIPSESTLELKSILKKSSGEEAAVNGGRGRVKFTLGGEENQMKNNMQDKTSSHLTMDFSSKNFQKAVVDPRVVSGPPPPMRPMNHGTALLAPPLSPLRVLSRPMSASLMTQKMDIDIAQQMLSLLTRCNDVVTNVSSILGYSPYHPL
ncbi:hypothetical protein SSX86_011112 [Deinandra increscens subsp. villosa]|uniref:PWWP domain-containing protein n=1 Tax=Deinandra increscens subsp. villosa TaxID=3103831 RepID=A0AAP0H5I9_9ASTR